MNDSLRSQTSRATGAEVIRTWQTEAAAIEIQIDQGAAELQNDFGTFDEACRSAVARLKELQKDRGGYRRKENLQNEPNQPEPELWASGGSGHAELPNEPEPAASRPAKLQNEPESGAAKQKFPNELAAAPGQLIEISRGGEVIALLRPEFGGDK